jgi:co-chaperonin GroES (HSP10)
MRLLRDNILIRPDTVSKVSAGGIILPFVQDESTIAGLVEEIGPDVKGIQLGDHVFFYKYSGTSIQIGRSDYILISSPDVLAILD